MNAFDDESTVTGRRLSLSLGDFSNRCEVHIRELQGASLPDNALIGTLCEAVRLAREYCDAMKRVGPIKMLLWCPKCGERHVDRGEYETKPHHTHACQRCGMVWRPATVATVGVQFLPGFKDENETGIVSRASEPDDALGILEDVGRAVSLIVMRHPSIFEDLPEVHIKAFNNAERFLEKRGK